MASGEDSAGTLIPIESEIADTITYVNWIIKDFDTLYEASTNDTIGEFAHLNFETGTNFGIKTKGEIYLSSRGTGTKDDLKFSLELYPCPEEEGKRILASYSITAEDNKGDLTNEVRSSQWPISKFKYGWNFYFTTVTKIRQNYLKEGVLTIRLAVKLHQCTEDLIFERRDTISARDCMKRDFAKGFEGLLASGELSDVSFSFPNGHSKNKDQEQAGVEKPLFGSGSGESSDAAMTFSNGESAHQEIEMKAHKVVLCVQSPVFAAMFLTQMKERITGKVIIEDISAKAFKKVLEFIYTEALGNDWESVADELMYAANKYELINLKYLIEEYIQDVVTVKNAIKLRKVAKLFNFQTAKNEIELYVKDHFIEFLDLMENQSVNN